VLPLIFSSSLPAERRDELEELMFFNPQQGAHESGINSSIRDYGFPKIVQEGSSLTIGIEGRDVQTLYAFIERSGNPELVGVIVYTRTSPHTIALLNMAVTPEYSYSSGYKNELVVVRMLTQLRKIARRINGIHKLSIAYGGKLITRAEV